MSLNRVRTTRPDGFRISSLALALALTAAGAGCDVPPEGADGVQALSSGLMGVVNNAVATESATAPVDMSFSLSRPFDSTSQPLNIVFSTFDFGTNHASSGSACGAGVDYVAVSNRPLTFPAGITTITTTVTVCPDNLPEGNETLGAHIVDAATGQCSGELCAAIGTIIDPAASALPSLRINDVTAHECLKGTCLATFTLSLSAASNVDVTVQAATANDTAVASLGGCFLGTGDYAPVNRPITIPAGATSATVSVAICSDHIAEPTERFFVNLSNAVNATITDGHGAGTILD